MYRLFYFLAVVAVVALCVHQGASFYAPALAATALGGLFPVWRRSGFYFAFLAGLLVWGVYAGYLHVGAEGRLGDRLAVTFGVPTGWVLVWATGLWGGMTAGLGGWLGASLRIALNGGKK